MVKQLPSFNMAGNLGIFWSSAAKNCCFVVLLIAFVCLPTALSAEPSLQCTADNDGDYVRDINNCSVAYVCSVSDGGWLKITCPEGHWFDLNINLCNVKYMVQCAKACLNNPCLQNGFCTDIHGGYRCSYPNHINGDKDNGDTQVNLLISQYGTREIFSFDQKDRSFSVLPNSFYGRPNVMEYVPETGDLFIAFENPNAIIKTNLENSFNRVLKSGVTSEGLAVDVSVNKLFFTAYDKKTINSMRTDGQGSRVLASGRLQHPRSIVVDKPNRVLYWIDISKGEIERSDYDGANRQVFQRTSNLPLALDLPNGGSSLYLCDNKDEIWELPLSGGARRIYKRDGDKLVCDSLAVRGQRLYTVHLLSNNIEVRDMSGKLVEQYEGEGKLKNGKFKTVELVLTENN